MKLLKILLVYFISQLLTVQRTILELLCNYGKVKLEITLRWTEKNSVFKLYMHDITESELKNFNDILQKVYSKRSVDYICIMNEMV